MAFGVKLISLQKTFLFGTKYALKQENYLLEMKKTSHTFGACESPGIGSLDPVNIYWLSYPFIIRRTSDSFTPCHA